MECWSDRCFDFNNQCVCTLLLKKTRCELQTNIVFLLCNYYLAFEHILIHSASLAFGPKSGFKNKCRTQAGFGPVATEGHSGAVTSRSFLCPLQFFVHSKFFQTYNKNKILFLLKIYFPQTLKPSYGLGQIRASKLGPFIILCAEAAMSIRNTVLYWAKIVSLSQWGPHIEWLLSFKQSTVLLLKGYES